MANPYFKFKEFTVYHDRCAMKVGTDGVLLGAWVDVANAKNILDVGTGSGLIALMVAQRNRKLTVDAIDIDLDAVSQTVWNVNNSPFTDRIKVQHISLNELAAISSCKYDVIVSNPPFFVHSLQSPDKQRTLARHTESLPRTDLLLSSAKLLSDNGTFSIIYPSDQKELLLKEGEKLGLFAKRITDVYSTPQSIEPKRVLIEFAKGKERLLKTNKIIIEKERHIYDESFTMLVKDFYLKL